MSVSIRVVAEVRDALFLLFWHQYNIHEFLRSTRPKIVTLGWRLGSGGSRNPCACTFWVGTYPWREYNLSEFVSDISSRKKDDIVAISN
jgi:hypothetical protein